MRYTSLNRTNPIFRHRKILLVAVFALALISGVSLALTSHQNTKPAPSPSKTTTKVKPVNTVDYTPATSSDNAISEQAKNSTGANKDNSTNNNTGESSQIGVTITRAVNQVNADDSKFVIVGSLVNGVSTGTCTLTATQEGQSSVTLQNNVEMQNTNYVCPNFVIPYSQFPSGGNWKFKLALTDGARQAENAWPDPVTVNK